MSMSYMDTVKFCKLHPDAVIPKRATLGSAGFDLCCLEDTTIKSKDRKLVSTGIQHECSPCLFGMLSPRSGLAFKKGLRLFFSPPIIDSDYRGEIKILLENTGDEDIHFKARERIAQIVYVECFNGEAVIEESLSDTERGSGGFGSTGIE